MSYIPTANIDFSRLNQRITIERAVNHLDENGGILQTWQPWKTVWASIEPLSNSEHSYLLNVKGNQISHVIIIRYLADLKLSDRCCWHQRIFHPHSIINQREQDRFITLLTTELVTETTIFTDPPATAPTTPTAE